MGNLKRQQEILELMKKDNYMTVEYLAARLFASPSSIRRDLTQLEYQGFVKRSYGGAALATQPAGLAPFAMRRQENRKEKMQVAELAAALIRPDSTVYLDSSTTALNFVDILNPEWNITVCTNNLHLAHQLASRHIATYLVGGLLSDRDCAITTGSYAIGMLENIYVDQMIFTCTALSDSGRITDADEAETQVRKLVLDHARERIFMCPYRRYGNWAQHLVTTLDEVEYLVSDQPLPAELKERFPDVIFWDSHHPAKAEPLIDREGADND